MLRVRLFTLIILTISFCKAHAIPAKPGILEYVQPDGSVVHVKLYGDERSHFYLTTDNYPLYAKGDTLFFACTDDDGMIQASEFMAANDDLRLNECNAFLNKTDKNFTLLKLKHQYNTKRKTYSQARSDYHYGLFPDASFPTIGNVRALVILVEFQDISFSTDYDPKDYFSRMLNQPGFSDLGAFGSASDYFRENSSNKFCPEFDVTGPIRLSKPEAFYGINGLNAIDKNAGLMVIDACRMLDSEIDFSLYDCDNDGSIDNVFIFYAGRGEASGGGAMTIWPHSSDIKFFTQEKVILDGKVLGRYACSNELINDQPDGIGTFVHEFSHVLGLPDLYATKYTEAFTPGYWDIMDYGSYNNNSRTPPLMSSFERHALGWTSTVQPMNGNLQIPALAYCSGGFRYPVTDSEAYYLETRIKQGWDSFIPGEGLLIWHTNYSPAVWNINEINNDPQKQHVDIIEADRHVGESTRAGDCFPGTEAVHSVDFKSHPDLATWADHSGPFALTNISFDGKNVYAKFSSDASDTALETPVLNSDFNITPNSFIISWSEVEGAETYEIDVQQTIENQIIEEKIDFNSGSAGIPDKWDIKLGFSSFDVVNPEDSSPMLMFLQNGGFITSPKYFSEISKIDFSIMASGRESRQPFIEVYIPNDDSWLLIDHKVLAVDNSIYHMSYDLEDYEVDQFRIRFGGQSDVKIFFDNLSVMHRVESLDVSLSGFPITNYTQNKLQVCNLTPETTYNIFVTAVGNDKRSQTVTTSVVTYQSATINNISNSQNLSVYNVSDGIIINSDIDAQADIFSVNGQLIQTFAITPGLNKIQIKHSGILILRIGEYSYRTLITNQ